MTGLKGTTQRQMVRINFQKRVWHTGNQSVSRQTKSNREQARMRSGKLADNQTRNTKH